MGKRYRIAVGGLIPRGAKVLLHHRTDYDMWDLPSGGMEAGETIVQALQREILEETGYHVRPIRLVGVYHNFGKEIIFFLFLVRRLSGKLRLNPEADAFQYFSYRALPKNLPPKKRQRIQDFFRKPSVVTVRVQRSVSSIQHFSFRKKRKT
ncbi:MAG: NUDIX domain-containing protein [Patescibacteria group bacterium]